MIERIWTRWADLVSAAEEVRWGPGTVAAMLAAVIAVRNLVEIVVARNPTFEALAAFVHYPLAYVGPFLALVLVLAAWARVPPARVARLMAMAWLLTLVPPLADLLLHHHREVPTIGYLAADPADIGWIIIHFFDPRVSFVGTTGGIRIETALAVLGGAFYVGLRSGRVWRAAAAAVTVYLTSLFFFLLPVLVLGVFRWAWPMTTQSDLLRGEGAIYRGATESAPDAAAVLWLVPVLAVLVVAWSRLERRGWAGGTGWTDPSRRVPRAGWTPGAFLALVALGGVFVAEKVLLPEQPTLTLPPYDILAPIGLALALLLGARLFHDLDQLTFFSRLAHGIGVMALALALGRSAGVGLAVALLMGLAEARLALRLPWRLPVSSLAGALSTAGAFASGWSLAMGPEALARLPMELLVASLVAGCSFGFLQATYPDCSGMPAFRSGLAACLLGSALAFSLAAVVLAGPALVTVALPLGLIAGGAWWWMAEDRHAWGRVIAGTLSGALFSFLLMGAASHAELRSTWREQVRKVARLERIKAERYQQRGQWNEARSVFKNALDLDPEDIGSLRGLGLGYIRENRIKRGTTFLERALRLSPDDPQQLVNLAAAYLEQDRAAEALKLLERALQHYPRDLLALQHRCSALAHLGRRDEAQTACRAFLDLAAGRPGYRPAVNDVRRQLRRLQHGQGGVTENPE
ncbi:MAG: tetratricopeptide repeat protein [Acidobacteriota bacterium]|nr:tetratricopeptide repeat protein [Acidobacteriota bacterium]